MAVLRWCGYLLITIAVIWAGIVYVTLPVYDGTIHIKSKYGKVTIYRDDHGIPHLFAENEQAAYFGTGYLHASDRMWVHTNLLPFYQGREKYEWADVDSWEI